MNRNTLNSAKAANVPANQTAERPKAKRIILGIDAHLRGYQVARKIDEAHIGAVSNCHSEAEVLLLVQRQVGLAEEVVAVYEAGPLGYGLYRQITAAGARCYVCGPQSEEQRQQRRKTNALDARRLAGKLFNYLGGNPHALVLARIPSPEQERRRLQSRQHDQLVKARNRLGAQGNAVLLAQGFGSLTHWWRPRCWQKLSPGLPEWIVKMLDTWRAVLELLDRQIQQAKADLSAQAPKVRPKGFGAQSLVQLQAEVLDWNLYPNPRSIGCLGGMVPSEWSTGPKQRRGSITKVGVPAIRRLAIEMVWRLMLFQPHYPPIRKWWEALHSKNPALKKKAVVAVGRELLVDLWRMQTGRITPQELNLVMIGA